MSKIVKAFCLPGWHKMQRQTPDAVGFDLHTNALVGYGFDDSGFFRERITWPGWFHLCSRRDVLVGFGTILEMPSGCYAEVRLRGSAAQAGFVNFSENPIDSGFRGEFVALLGNRTDGPIPVRQGERLCQLIFLPNPFDVEIAWVDSPDKLSRTVRGNGCHGSTGMV